MFNGGMFNGPLYNGSNFTYPDTRTYSTDQPYIMHIRSSADVFLRKVEDWRGGEWVERMNDPGSLRFELPLDGTVAQSGDVAYPNRIHLYDGSMEKLREFVIVKTTVNAVTGTMRVDCAGLMYLLKQEFAPIRSESSFSGNMRLQVISALSYQDNASPITLAYMAPKYVNTSIVVGQKQDMSIFDLLMEIWKSEGGVLVIDQWGRLHWLDDTLGDPTAPLMKLNDDIEKYEEIEDASTVINRLYCYGSIHDDGANHDRQVLGGPGYIEDTTSQAAYGIRAARKTINAENVTELTSIANKILAYYKDPKVTRNISAIDLARVQLDPDTPTSAVEEYLFPGAKLRVIPPSNVPNSGVFDAMATSITRRLSADVGLGSATLTQLTITDQNPASPPGRGRHVPGSSTEFFDILAEGIGEIGIPQPSEFEEYLFEEDERIWDAINALESGIGAVSVETDVNQIKPVASAAALGTNTEEFAPSDHQHEGIPPLVYDASWTQQSDLGNPQEISIGYLDSGAGDDQGWWVYPPDGTTNADWKPMNYYA